jgi:pSer/pThr/pTyr-binding forkhead associated (FHA) protein
MLKCSNCGKENREGTLFCDNCGFSITDAAVGQATVATRRIQNDPDESIAKATWGAARFQQGSVVILHIKDASDPINIKPVGRLVVGRSDANSTIMPDIDLAPFGAAEKGVSRQHAAIELSGDETLMVLDVGSSNGTFLNGQRLLPNQPRVLRDGDELRFGKLIAHIYFK